MFENVCLDVSGEKKSENEKWFPQHLRFSKFKFSDFRRKKSFLPLEKPSQISSKRLTSCLEAQHRGGGAGGGSKRFLRSFSLIFSFQNMFVFVTSYFFILLNNHVSLARMLRLQLHLKSSTLTKKQQKEVDFNPNIYIFPSKIGIVVNAIILLYFDKLNVYMLFFRIIWRYGRKILTTDCA